MITSTINRSSIFYKIYTQLIFTIIVILFLSPEHIFTQTISRDKGLFDSALDIGDNILPGKLLYNFEKDEYLITGSGNNIWAEEDEFFFVSRKVDGDLFLTANITWDDNGKHEHRKAGLMIRSGMDNDDAYVDVVLHGDGLLSMQYRPVKGGETFELQAPIKTEASLLLDKTGDQFTFGLRQKDGTILNVGTITVPLIGDLFAGLVVCSHDSTMYETALFSNVGFNLVKTVEMDNRIIESTLEIFDIDSGVRKIIRRAKEHFEAPNWSRDGEYLLYNSKGKLYKISINGGLPELINSSFANNCNNDHGISPDGKKIVISHHSEDGNSRIYTLPVDGGEPKLITDNGPSYWHGWSPDGNRLAYCAERNGEYDVYTISVEGGIESRLTDSPGLDDGPDYSPDGKHIFFNSNRTGQMKIWRMNIDGSEQKQWTPDDDYSDWFAHPSPDSKWLVFISYDKNVEGHPPNKDVVLRLMRMDGGDPIIIAKLFGGQGTINVPSWSPDSKKFSFVSYRLVSE